MRQQRLNDLETFQEEPNGVAMAAAPLVLVPTLTILYHPQVERIGARARLHELNVGQPALLSRTTPDFSSGDPKAAGPLADRNLSRNPIRLTAEGGGVRIDAGDRPTRVVVSGRPLTGAIDITADAMGRGVVMELAGRIVLLLHSAPSTAKTGDPFSDVESLVRSELLGESFGVQRLRDNILRVADLDVPVLIRGESGSGKELVARALHRVSARREGPFVAVNLGAIPQSLAVSELFGADKGAFTGAVRRQPGYFVQARGGTLFLDEVGEASPEIQVALLRALETGEIQSVGAQKPEKVDVRVVAATDADLEAKIASGDFRAPLLYRLSAYELRIPPLRERIDDIGRLLVYFLEDELSRVGEKNHLRSPREKGELWFPASIVARLAMHDWPGNVRQLRNVVRQLVISNRGRDHIEIDPDFERLLTRGAPAQSAAPASPVSPQKAPASEPEPPDTLPPAHRDEAPAAPLLPSERRKPSEVSEGEIEAALRACRWEIEAAAVMLRISRPSLYMLLEDNPRFRMSKALSAEEIQRAYKECQGDIARMVDRLEISEKALRRKLRALGI
jgi:two-component system, NtrC family, nitrogen regulation response regulator GlnG